jgi:hypothetical protein
VGRFHRGFVTGVPEWAVHCALVAPPPSDDLRLAFDRLQHDANDQRRTRGEHATEFLCVGTAIRPHGQATSMTAPALVFGV